MVNTLKLPVGIDSFEKIRRNGFYYIDKTNLIEQILMNWGEVTLFTRPRRFGKTLNMSMLKSFFEIGADVSLFEGLYIAKNKELCDAYMEKYPVIFLTLKGVEGLTFADAKRMLGTILANEMDRHYYLKTSDALTDEDKAYFAKMLTGTDENIEDSIRKLSQLLYKHHGKKVVIIIDEYDVPLDKAYQNGYYYFDPTYVLVLIGALLSIWASSRVQSTFRKYARVRSMSGMTGAQVAELILKNKGYYDVRVARVKGDLTDHYDPRTKVVKLSDSVYDSTSVAALGVAAHECGHVIQHHG